MELAKLGTLSKIVRSIQISESEDRWVFKLSGDGIFCVCLLRRLIDTRLSSSIINPTIFIKLVPIKVVCFVWHAYMGHIPTVSTLVRRGVWLRIMHARFAGWT